MDEEIFILKFSNEILSASGSANVIKIIDKYLNSPETPESMKENLRSARRKFELVVWEEL